MAGHLYIKGKQAGTSLLPPAKRINKNIHGKQKIVRLLYNAAATTAATEGSITSLDGDAECVKGV